MKHVATASQSDVTHLALASLCLAVILAPASASGMTCGGAQLPPKHAASHLARKAWQAHGKPSHT